MGEKQKTDDKVRGRRSSVATLYKAVNKMNILYQHILSEGLLNGYSFTEW